MDSTQETVMGHTLARFIQHPRSRALLLSGLLPLIAATAVAGTARREDRPDQAVERAASRLGPSGDTMEAEIARAVRQGDVLVEEIYRYRAATGLWPLSLADLDRQRLSPEQVR